MSPAYRTASYTADVSLNLQGLSLTLLPQEYSILNRYKQNVIAFR